MATGDFVSATIQSGGATARVVFEYSSSPTVASHPKYWPEFTVGSGGNLHTIKCLGFGSPTSDGGGNYYVDCELTGYGYSGETITADIPSAFLNDGSTDSDLVSSGSVTNSSGKTQGDAYTRHLGIPIAAWAIIDRWWDHDDETAVPVALDAIDNWAGISHVDLTLSLASGVAVNTGVHVTDQGGGVYRVDAKRLIDLHGKGEQPYWYLTLDISSASDGTVCTVTEVTVRTNDGVDHSLIADGRMTQRVVRKLSSPTTLYVDAAATGSADGSSWADAFTTIAAAETAAGTGTERVLIAPGDYSVTQDFDQYRSTAAHDWLIWDADLSQAGDGSGGVRWTNAASRNVRTLNFLRGMSIDNGTLGYLRFASAYAGIALVEEASDDKTQNSSPMTIQGVPHISVIGGSFVNGNKVTIGAVLGVVPSDCLFHLCEFDTLGTSFTGAMYRSMIDGFVERNGNQDTAPGTHTDGIHNQAVVPVSGMSWAESSQQMSKASAFTSVLDFASAHGIAAASAYASGGTGVTPYYEYPLDEKLDNSTIQSLADLTSGGDISDLAASIRSLGFSDVICRNGFQYGGGDAATGRTQNIVLLESGTRDTAIYNWRHCNEMSTQQVIQLQNFYDNVQLVGITSAPADNDAEGDERGLMLSANFTDEEYWYFRGRLLVRNCALPTGNVATTSSLDSLARLRAAVLGPNWYSNASPSNPTKALHGLDGSAADDGSGGIASFGFLDYDADPPDLRPSAGSNLIGDVTPAKDDRWFDSLNIALADNTPYSVGALQPAAPTVSGISPTSVAVGDTVDITVTGAGFVDGIAATSNDAGAFTVNSTTWNSSTEVVVSITGEDGTAGNYVDAITLTNPDGQSDSFSLTLQAAVAGAIAVGHRRRTKLLGIGMTRSNLP